MRGRPGGRRDHSTETPGSKHPTGARSYEGGLIRDSELTSQRDAMQERSRSPEPTTSHPCEGRVRSRSRTSRRDSQAALRVRFLDTPGEGCLRASEPPQGTTPFSLSMTSVRAPGKLVPETIREWSAIGERVATTPAGPQAQELSPIAPVGLRTMADRPACMQPTPARPLYQAAEGEVAFRTPGQPPVLQGSERLPSTEPMDRHTRVTRLEGRNDQAVPTPRVRIDRALEETQRPEHRRERRSEQDIRDARALTRCDHSPSSLVSSSRSTEGHLETLYLQQSRLLGVLQAPKVSISTFDGDPMAYFPFIRVFVENVEKLLDDEGSKLTRLMQLCTGKAARALQCCSMLPPAQGHKKARQILKARFGDPFTITEVWVDKLID